MIRPMTYIFALAKYINLNKTIDLYNSDNFNEIKIIRTKYENKFLEEGK